MKTERKPLHANSTYHLLALEPVQASGERLNVGAFCVHKGKSSSRLLIRNDVLCLMYGPAGDAAMRFIQSAISFAAHVDSEQSDSIIWKPFVGLHFSSPISAYAVDEEDLYRQIAIMNRSLHADTTQPT